MKTTAIVWNPSKIDRDKLATALEDHAVGHLTWHETTKNDPGQGAASEALASNPQIILVAGGDGTVRAVIERLAREENPPALGILPLGTGNLLARNLDIPIGDLKAATARAISAASPRPLDVGWINFSTPEGSHRMAFAVIAGIGIDAQMIVETNDELKAKTGWLAYIESLGRAFKSTDLIEVDLTIDDMPTQRVKAHTFLLGNCGTLQGGLTLLPDADPCDGQLDLLVSSSTGGKQWFGTAKTMLWDNGVKRLFGSTEPARDSASTIHRTFTSIGMVLSEPRHLQIDGEDVGRIVRLEARVQEHGMSIL